MKSIKEILPAIVYGGSDGAVTTFSVMAGALGAGFDPRIIIILGFANVASDGFSMAAADYLSEQSKDKATKKKSFLQAFVTLISFIGIGLIPLLPFLFALSFALPTNQFLLSSILTFLAFVAIGYMRAYILNKNKLTMIGESVIIGTLCAGLAYFVGQYLSHII